MHTLLPNVIEFSFSVHYTFDRLPDLFCCVMGHMTGNMVCDGSHDREHGM